MTVRIAGISGSLRRASFNTGLLRAAAEVAGDGVEIEIFALNELPVYNADVEVEGMPASVVALHEAMRQADALLFSTPQYNGSISGVMKNAIDWTSRANPSVLSQKPAAVIGATVSPFGALIAQRDMRTLLLGLGCYVMPAPMLAVPGAGQRFDADGNLTDDELRPQLASLVEALAAWATRYRTE